MADAVLQHGVQNVRPQTVQRQHQRIMRHDGADGACRINPFGQNLVGEITGRDDALQLAIGGHGKARDMGVAHDLGRGADRGLRRHRHGRARNQITHLAGGDIGLAGFLAAAAVKEPLKGRIAGDQAAKLHPRQHQDGGGIGGARGGHRDPIAHQPAFAQGIARPKDRDENPRRVHHLNRTLHHKEQTFHRIACGVDHLIGGQISAAEGSGDSHQLVLRQTVVGVDRFQKSDDRGGVVTHRWGPCGGAPPGRSPRRRERLSATKPCRRPWAHGSTRSGPQHAAAELWSPTRRHKPQQS